MQCCTGMGSKAEQGLTAGNHCWNHLLGWNKPILVSVLSKREGSTQGRIRQTLVQSSRRGGRSSGLGIAEFSLFRDYIVIPALRYGQEYMQSLIKVNRCMKDMLKNICLFASGMCKIMVCVRMHLTGNFPVSCDF